LHDFAACRRDSSERVRGKKSLAEMFSALSITTLKAYHLAGLSLDSWLA
jgi:hypothetical protein